MISQLITTLIMAIGIATGNVSSNAYKGGNVLNTSQEKTKPTIKKANNVDDTYDWWGVSDFQEQTPGANIYYGNAKWLPVIERNGNTEYTATISTEYYNIYTTSYTGKTFDNRGGIIGCYTLYKITPYFNFSATEITLHQTVRLMAVNNTATYSGYYWNYTTTNDITPYIDMTYNANTRDELLRKIYREWTPRNEESSTAISTTTQSNEMYFQTDNDYTTPPITANNSINVVMVSVYQITNTTMSSIDGYINPLTLNINGNATIPSVNYEVVDIPNLMFTIISLPFSFISNAFNLTIFPNTPYQLNFTNLFMTILAAFILTWLIRKVFK